MLHWCITRTDVGMLSVRTRAIMALEQCSSSVNPAVAELVKNVLTPRFTDRQRSVAHLLVRTPTDSCSDDSHRQSGHTGTRLYFQASY